MSQELRSAILLFLNERHRVDPGRTVDDTEIAHALGVPLDEARRQLDILEAQRLTREANTFGGHSAWISSEGMVHVEKLPPAVLQRWKAIASLRRTIREQIGSTEERLEDLREALQLFHPQVGISVATLADFVAGAGIPGPAVLAAFLHHVRNVELEQALAKMAPAVVPVEKELLRRVAESPESVFELQPREFEELVAEILDKMGMEVQLTPHSRDGGRDILATLQTSIGDLLTVVECKRYSSDRPVDLAIVERMLHTIREKDRASVGMIVTTSRFTTAAVKAALDYKWQIQLKDYEILQGWLRKYGTFFESPSSGLWMPNIQSA